MSVDAARTTPDDGRGAAGDVLLAFAVASAVTTAAAALPVRVARVDPATVFRR